MFGSTNVTGQAYLLMVFTPVKAGQADDLRAFLEGLDRQASPMARSSRTHFARWIVMADMPQNAAQPTPDHLDGPYLVFTANFDGDLESYLDELCEQLAPEAPEIWGRCVGCPQPATGAALKAYLRHNQVDCGVAYAAYGDTTVTGVRRALDKRARLGAFAVRAQAMSPEERHRAFMAEFGGA